MSLSLEVEQYISDGRLGLLSPPIPHINAKDPRTAVYYLSALDAIMAADWHWLNYLYARLPPDQNLWEFARICAFLDSQVPHLGGNFISALGRVSGKVKDEGQYQQMLQVFAEVFCIYHILNMPWSENAIFEHEPIGINGKRPEFRVSDNGQYFTFEVKASSLLDHQRRRSKAPTQIPARLHPDVTSALNKSGGGNALMPRDNPIKDFLKDANQKFNGFERDNSTNILIIVWDDFIYEPLASLNGETGLLTANSFHRVKNAAVVYEAIDMVICLRHLGVFQQGLAERELPDGRETMFSFGKNRRTTNVHIPTLWGKPVPSFIYEGFKSVDSNHELLREVAEYRTPEYIIWLGVPLEIVSNGP